MTEKRRWPELKAKYLGLFGGKNPHTVNFAVIADLLDLKESATFDEIEDQIDEMKLALEEKKRRTPPRPLKIDEAFCEVHRRIHSWGCVECANDWQAFKEKMRPIEDKLSEIRKENPTDWYAKCREWYDRHMEGSKTA